MRRRKRAWQLANQLLIVLISLLMICQQVPPVQLIMMLSSKCLSSAPGCVCTWKGGKFVADCVGQSLTKVPKNDYDEFLAKHSGNTQMLTLNRDLQQLNLATNNISNLEASEFSRKRYLNLQRIALRNNKLASIHPSAFDKLMGLVELDLSENLIANDEQEAEANNDVEFNGRGENRLSFLQHLAQLRQLNLASNHLSQLDKFTFSQLTQLRQLSLSSNKISFIHRQAFDGLKLLEVLQLDGNKLSHLDGGILLELPKLNAIQLAGSNPWRCDCRLREFVRNLMSPASSGAALNGATAGSLLQLPISAGRLLDKPMCVPMHPRRLSDDESITAGGGGGGSMQPEDPAAAAASSWTNMKLSQFECPPQPALKFMPVQQGDKDWPFMEQVMNMNEYLSQQEDEQDDDHHQAGRKSERQESGGDNHASDKNTTTTNNNNNWLAKVHLAPSEPLELTCAIELTDELDLELSQLEWWRLNGAGRRPTLLWRLNSSDSTATSGGHSMHVIDYVTRANGSTSTDTENEIKLVRLEHLLQGSSGQTMDNQTGGSTLASNTGIYLCRVTNKAGHLHVYHSVAASFASETESRRRRKLRKVALETVASQLGDQLVEAAKLGPSWLAAARRAIQHPPPPERPLFVPVHLPEDLLAPERASSSEILPTRPPEQPPASLWRPTTTRQVNRTRIPYAESANNKASHEEPKNANTTSTGLLNRPDLTLHSIALGLIGRYTSNLQTLIEGEVQSELLGPDEDEDDLISSTGLQSPAAATMDYGAKSILEGLRSTWRQAKRRYLDKWSLVESNYLLVVLCLAMGLLTGVTLATLVILRLRKTAVGSHRVGDSSCNSKALEQDEDEERDSQSPPGEPESTLGELGVGLAQVDVDKATTSGGSSAGGSTSNGSQCKLIKCFAKQGQPLTPIRQVVCQQPAANYELFLQDQSYQSDLEADVSGALEDSLASYAMVGGRQPADLSSYERLGAVTCQQDPPALNGSRPRQLIVLQAPDYPQQELQELLLSPYYAEGVAKQHELPADSFRLNAAQDQLLEACQQVGLANTLCSGVRHANQKQKSVSHLDNGGHLCSIAGQDLVLEQPFLQQYGANLNSLTSPAASTSSSQLTVNIQRTQEETAGPRSLECCDMRGNVVYLDDALELLQSSVDACRLLQQSSLQPPTADNHKANL